jgi:hypothetical protein
MDQIIRDAGLVLQPTGSEGAVEGIGEQQMTCEQKTPHVYAAIAAVTAKLAKVGIGKDHKNDQQGYKFRGIDDVYNALASEISAEGLCLLPRVTSRDVTERQTQRGGTLFYVVVGVDYDLISAKDGSKHTVQVIGEAMDSGDKATNKAMSAAYKYMAMQVFCIPTQGENEGDATTHKVKPTEKALPYTDTSKQPGIGVHSPLGDVVLTDKSTVYADAFREALTKTDEDVRRVDDDLREEGQEAYVAVWSLLNSKERKAIKTALGK